MTPTQKWRLTTIVDALLACKTHPSAKVRESVAGYASPQVHQAAEMVKKVIGDDDGHVAYALIGAWAKGGERGTLDCMFKDPICGHLR